MSCNWGNKSKNLIFAFRSLIKNKIKIYPNPVVDELTVYAPEMYKTEVYSIIGELIISTSEKKVDCSSLYQGVYFVVVKDNTGQTVISKKIIKK